MNKGYGSLILAFGDRVPSGAARILSVLNKLRMFAEVTNIWIRGSDAGSISLNFKTSEQFKIIQRDEQTGPDCLTTAAK